MDPNDSLESIRAWAEGRLEPEALEALRARMQSDGELRQLAQEYAVVHQLSEALEQEPGTCRLTFEALEAAQRRAPARPIRRAAAAAALVVLLGAGFWILAGPAMRGSPTLLTLRAIPRPSAPPPPAAELPVRLADYRPTADGRIRWLSDFERARALSAWTGRPLLVFGTLPGCPMCCILRETSLSDPRVVDMAREFIPLEVDLSSCGEERAEMLMARGYPAIEVQDSEGRPLLVASGTPDAASLEIELGVSLERRTALLEPMDWNALRELAGLYARARAAERNGPLGSAERLYEKVLAKATTPPFEAAARGGLERLRYAAHELVRAAQDAGREDPEGAVALLRAARPRFDDTSFAADLDQLSWSIRRSGRFPELRFASL